MALVIFYTSLFTLTAMFAMKYFGISFTQHEAISNLVDKNNENCHKIVHHSKRVASKIRYKNFHKLTLAVANFIKEEMIYLKRRFDSKQPAFFLSPQRPSHIHKNSVSFFIKNVTDYKNSLRKKDL